MFTNWLTGTTGGSNKNSSDNRGNATGPPNSNPPGATLNGSSHILMSTPPDIVLEVGPAPGSVRFVAHSIVLGMHSGYLRSAIRLDEQQATSSSTATTAANRSPPDFVLYLGNVTAEQFAPLLTYMYTGYLDLNIENIFGVLLATHVLHMPRALEICRNFLARAQTDGYLGNRLNNLVTSNPIQHPPTAPTTTITGNGKIIRPIPSKATLPNFGFLPTIPPPPAPITPHQQQQQLLQHSLINFKGLQRESESNYQNPIMTCETLERAKSEEIDVDQESIKAPSETDDTHRKLTVNDINHDDDEDEEVFIDSSNSDSDNDDTEVIIECRQPLIALSSKRHDTKSTTTTTTAAAAAPSSSSAATTAKLENLDKSRTSKKSDNRNKSSKSSNRNANTRREKRRQPAAKPRNSSGLQIAKAPIPASQLDANEGSKVIIDVASCDGPVRFRRILNTAYGHKPEDFATQMPERSQQSVSYSFHQQMARTINQQRQQLQQQNANAGCTGGGNGEESENSESSGGSKHGGAKNSTNSNEIYVCVYCKHTFKSQYCYQKHAKRHLNPLSLTPSERCEKSTLNPHYNGPQYSNSAAAIPLPLVTSKQTATDLLRREVRPLDMNVQYYPCKTCGSKFPSYYFVHKHRKMCHADEESTPSKDNGGTTRAAGEIESETDYVDGELNRNANIVLNEANEEVIEVRIDGTRDGNNDGNRAENSDNSAEHISSEFKM